MKSKPVLAMLHGWGMNPRVFDALSVHLEDHFELMPLALPGHDGQAMPTTHSLKDWAAQVSADLPAASTLLGWSLGGQVAMQLALDYPCKVQRLILMSSTPKFVQAVDWQAGIPAVDLKSFGADLQNDASATLLRFLTLQTRGATEQKTLMDNLRATFLTAPMAEPRALVAGLELLLDTDLREATATLSQPTLVIHGSLDKLTPANAGAWLAHTLPAAHYCLLKSAAHAPFLSHPQQVAEAILGWAHD